MGWTNFTRGFLGYDDGFVATGVAEIVETKESKISFLVSRHPEKNYGKVTWGDIAGTILATDYKSPPLCLVIYEEDYSA